MPSRRPYLCATLVVLWFALASATATAQEIAPDAAEEPPTARLLTLFAELSGDLERAGEDCDAVATSLNGWTQSHGSELAALTLSVATHLETLDATRVAELERKLGTHFDIVIGSAVVCAEHPQTLAAFEAMERMLEQAAP